VSRDSMKLRLPTEKTYRFSILQALLPIVIISIVGISLNFIIGSTRAVVELSDHLVEEVSQRMIERTLAHLEGGAMHNRVTANLVSDLDLMNNHETVWRYLWAPMIETPQVQSLFVADRRGNYVQVRREPFLATRMIDAARGIETTVTRDESYREKETKTNPTTWDPRTRPWYKNTTREKKMAWTDVFVFTTAKTPGLSASYPVLDAQGEIVGVIAANIPLHNLSDFVAEQKVMQHGIVLIINDKGEVVAYPDKKVNLVVDSDAKEPDPKEHKEKEMRLLRIDELPNQAVVDAYRRSESEKSTRVTSATNGEKYITTFKPFPAPFEKLKIVIVIPEADILASIHRMELIAILVSVVILILGIIVVYQVSIRISDPIIRLAHEMDHIGDFSLDDVKGVQSKIHEIRIMNSSLLTAVEGLKAFRRYLPASFVRQLITSGKKAELGGIKTEITLFFSDVEGFTRISESMPAEDLMLHLSAYFNELSRIILEEGGTIDKYIGDAIMVFWGQPVEIADAPIRACRAALRCVERLTELNEKWSAEGKPTMRTRFAIHTGESIVGNVGTEERMNYSAVGDSVNLTSRLESANKIYGTTIIISQSTFERVQHLFRCRLLDVVAVRGKTRGVRIYELLGESTVSPTEAQNRFVAGYEQAFSVYLSRNWQEAVQAFSKLNVEFPADKSVQVMLRRCDAFAKDAPGLPPNWDGTMAMLEK
ncbi:MAG TPA: adenylate/guanylate cyclase domain-containing protein, partial [Leptospiraceae bacterium]|nr:adenylate/guanylate cyclase domain-containing protein [Leptospiraceae bacterium]